MTSHHDGSSVAIALYIMLVVVALCAVPLVVVFIQWQCAKRSSRKSKCFSFSDADETNLLEAGSVTSAGSGAALSVYDRRLEPRV